MTEINVKEGELVWYDERKRYGFVKIDDTEVFLHHSTLDRFGLVRLFKGDRVTVSLTVNEHGEVIQDLLRVVRPVNPVPPRISPKMFLYIHVCSMIVGFIRSFRVKNC